MRDKKGRFIGGVISERRNGKELPCQLCGKIVYIPKYRIKSFKFCSRKCSSKLSNINRKYKPLSETIKNKISKTLMGKIIGNKHYNWKGGRYYHADGYVYIYTPNHKYKNKDGYVFEHRLVMEKKLGRYLLPSEQIHHINGIKDDNRLNNLMIIGNSAHLKLEWKHNNNMLNSSKNWFKKGMIPWNKSI